MVKLVMTRGLSSGVKEANLGKCASHSLSFTVSLFHAENGDGFMSSIGDNDKSSRRMDTNSSTCIHCGRKGSRHCLDRLNQFEARTTFELIHRQPLFCCTRYFREKLSVNRKHSHRGAKLIDNIGNIELWMEVNITWTIWFPRTHSTGQHVELTPNLAPRLIVPKLANQILPEVRNVRHAALKGIEHQGMGVRVHLSLRNGRIVVHGMIDPAVFLGGGEHGLALAGVVDALDGAGEFARFLAQWDDDEGGIPIVDCDQVTLLAIDGQVACGCTACIYAANFGQASIRMNLVGKNLTIFFNVFSACVHDIEPRMKARKRGVNHLRPLTGNVQ
mmetsp:Transcript_23088/g.48677  ORF Transcript_23088/g.48677 Transcript_23088/m.48677 type:complete len:331 (-) Transcript_23088:531-1523(-)